VALAANRVLLRDAWGEQTTEVHAFSWNKAAAGSSNQPLWANGAWALSTVILKAFCETGLQFQISGVKSPGVLENLQLRPYRSGKAEPVLLPIEVLLGDTRTLDLAQSGITPLVAQPGTDSAYYPAAPTFHQPARYNQEEATMASYRAATLAYQLFAGMAAKALNAVARSAGGAASEADVAQRIQDGMLAFLANAEAEVKPEEVTVEVAVNPENPSALEVAVRLRPAFALGGGPADLMLGTQVAR
jgi:type VI secretion system protein ImpC